MQNAFSCARVSTEDQRHNASISTQLAANQTYAHAHALTIVQEFVDEYTGATLDRPGMTELLRRIRAGEVQHIIVYSLDRLTRDPGDFLQLRKELHARGVTIHVAREDRALSIDPLDDLPDDVKAIVAKHERAMFRERSMRGVRAKVESGRPIGCGPAPYGYRWEGVRRERTLHVHTDEAPIVGLIFGWYVVDRYTVPQIVRALNERAIPTRADTSGRPKRFDGWNAGSVRAILRNPIYSGQGMAFRKRNATIGAKHATARARSGWRPYAAPQIVRIELVRLAQAQLAEGRALSERRTRRAYLLRCRIRCACGYSMTGTTTHGGARSAYRCISRDTARGRTPCGLPYVPAAVAEQQVMAWLRDEVLDPARLQAQLARLASTPTAPDPYARDRQRLDEIDRRIHALIDLYLDERMPKAVLDQKHADLLEEQGAIVARLRDAPQPAPAFDPAFAVEVAEFARIIAAGLRRADRTPEHQRRIVDLLDVRLTVAEKQGHLIANATCTLRRDVVRLFVDASNRSSCFQSETIEFATTLTLVEA